MERIKLLMMLDLTSIMVGYNVPRQQARRLATEAVKKLSAEKDSPIRLPKWSGFN